MPLDGLKGAMELIPIRVVVCGEEVNLLIGVFVVTIVTDEIGCGGRDDNVSSVFNMGYKLLLNEMIGVVMLRLRLGLFFEE